MQTTTLSFENLHNHGELFANMFRAQRDLFIGLNKSDLPEALGMEFVQYDTPASRWVVVHDENGNSARDLGAAHCLTLLRRVGFNWNQNSPQEPGEFCCPLSKIKPDTLQPRPARRPGTSPMRRAGRFSALRADGRAIVWRHAGPL